MLIQRKIDSAGLAFEVVNAGVSGETSSGLLDRLDWLLRGDVPDVSCSRPARTTACAAFRRRRCARTSRRRWTGIKAKRPDARVVLVQMEALPNLGPKYAADFHAVYPTVAKEKGVTLLPFLLDGRRGASRAESGRRRASEQRGRADRGGESVEAG